MHLDIELKIDNIYNNVFEGRIDFSDYERDNIVHVVNAEDRGLRQKITSRINNKVNQLSSESLGGETMLFPIQCGVNLFSRHIILISSSSKDIQVADNDGSIDVIEYTSVTDEANIQDIVNYKFISQTPAQTGDYSIRVRCNIDHDANVQAVVNALKNSGSVANFYTGTTSAVSTSIDETRIVNMTQGDELEIVMQFIATTGSMTLSNVFIDIEFVSVSEDSKADGLPIHEYLAFLLRQITDETDPLRSNAFGSTISQPFSYPTKGTYADYFVTSGALIRGYNVRLTPNISDKPLQNSFAEVMQSINSIFAVGWGIDEENNKAIIEPINFFFDGTLIKSFSYAEFTEKPAKEYFIVCRLNHNVLSPRK